MPSEETTTPQVTNPVSILGSSQLTPVATGNGDPPEENDHNAGALEWPPPDVMRGFASKEISFDVFIGGIWQTYVRKKFDMDLLNSPVHLYVDLEILDKSDKLFNYMLLSAHFNSKTKTLALSRAMVRNVTTQAKYIVLAILRTKCNKPRYDPLELQSNNYSLLLYIHSCYLILLPIRHSV